MRSALSALKYEGLLRSVQGKGVFVNGSKTERDLETFGGYRQTMDERSIDAHTRVLIKALRPAGPYYSKLLDLAEDDQVWFIRRIDYSNNEPVALEEIYIPEYDIVQEVTQLLTDVRKELGISQKELSEKTNIPQASISKFENGRNVPSLQILQRLADGLGKRLIVDFVEPEEEN